MNIKKALTRDCVMLDLKSSTKNGVIEEMVDHLVSVGRIGPGKRDTVLAAILERERKMSTGMQHGIAIPHAKTDAVNGLITAVALKKEGLDFDSLDGQPSRIFVMTVSPMSRTGPHIQFLADIGRHLNDPAVQEKLLKAETTDAVLDLL